MASHVFATVVFKLQYDVLTDLEPVALMTIVADVAPVARVNLPANNLKELIAWLKANPDKATCRDRRARQSGASVRRLLPEQHRHEVPVRAV